MVRAFLFRYWHSRGQHGRGLALAHFLSKLAEDVLNVWVLLLKVQVKGSSLREGLKNVSHHEDPGFRVQCGQLDDL
uniref:Uncharacterized protein n=1 Tax=Anguilla anguilla TaxID=7936 RepID=A0A0E9UVU2_ANGAN